MVRVDVVSPPLKFLQTLRVKYYFSGPFIDFSKTTIIKQSLDQQEVTASPAWSMVRVMRRGHTMT